MSTRQRAELGDRPGDAPVILQPRRILIVSHRFPPQPSGIGDVAAAEAAHLAASGNQVAVMSTGGRRSDARTPDGYRVVRVGAWEGRDRRRGMPFPVSGPTLFAEARRLVRWADLVHIHDVRYMPCWAAAWAAHVAGRPVLVTQHAATVAPTSAAARAAQRAVYAAAGARILRAAARVVVVNPRVEGFVASQGVERSRIRLLPNGVDTQRFRPPEPGERERLRRAYGLPEDAVLALFVGRPAPRSGRDRLLAAVSDDDVVVLVGGGRIPGVPDDGRTIFLGPLAPAAVADVYRAADLLVLPSGSARLPLSVHEAMASGLPVILRQDEDDDPYGLADVGVRFVDGGPETIRREISDLAADPQRRRALGDAARDHARTRFAWREHTARLETIWDEILEEGL